MWVWVDNSERMLNMEGNTRAPPGSSMNRRISQNLWKGPSGAGDINHSLLVAGRSPWLSKNSAPSAGVIVGKTAGGVNAT